ncbi:MAG: IS21-like element helper ATPase IstB [Candidatus Obscuribacterales bacterium]|nr:IS21-like element helper ATPase IstB [Candidatus Obscuribacterales bacterium]
MLIQPTIENLKMLKLFGMIQALESQMQVPDHRDLSFEDRFGMIVDTEMIIRENKKMNSRLKTAKLAQSAAIEDIEVKGARGIDKSTLAALATSDWVRLHQNVIISGATGVGKSYLACALAHKSCRDGFTVVYERVSRLLEGLSLARVDGSYNKRLAAIKDKDVLVLDDFGLAPLTAEQRRDLLEVLEDRYDRGSTIITSQLPIEHWHEIIGDPTIADAILDRVVHNSHKLHLKGESRRKTKAKDLQLAS